MNDTTDTTAAEPFDMPIDCAEIVYVLKHPISGLPTAARITLAGPVHPIRRALMFGRMRTMLAAGILDAVNLEDDDANETAFVAACTLGWSALSLAGEPQLFAIGAAQKLYTDSRCLWLRDQVRDALRQRDLFISGAPTAGVQGNRQGNELT